MNVFVPFTRVQPCTLRSVAGYRPQFVWVGVPDGYRRYWERRWADGETFISVEHDMDLWSGALDGLMGCPEPWCVYGYHDNDVFADEYRTLFPYLGCVKFSAELIWRTPDVWADADDWLTMDRHIAGKLRPEFVPHQHWPKVRNANPVLDAEL